MSKYKEIKVALLGAGTVGGGVYKLVERRAAEMPDKVGAELKITKVLVKNLQKKREGIPSEVLTDDWEGIIHDPEISIVIELMGGVEPARTYILQALEAGKNVVTANKDLLAEHGQELMEAAERNHRDLCFEAAVGGGIPIIRPLKECLAGNEITEVMGIVNGTTNYILTKMTQEGWDFDDALKEAQRLGFAEADPTADVEGLDAGRKMAILASIAFHSRVTFKDVDVKGITKITAKDIQYAKEFGYTLKLLGVARNEEGKMEVGVSPMMIPSTHPLANVNDSFNAVFVHGDAVDDAMFQGRGAGEFPTASAVVGDLISVARDMQYDCCGRIGCSCYKNLSMKPAGEARHKYFLRLIVEDRTGILAGVAGVLGNNGVSINQVIQKPAVNGVAELVVITDKVETRHLNDAMMIFGEMSMIREVASVIRVYTQK
ncbi:MAG: homoserine dehydrogenase [Clostridiaceae bacterium]|nr:homoserine dehydrogenase [Clostridiaceae bacterium]